MHMKCNPSWLNYFWLISLPHLIEDIFVQHFLLLPHTPMQNFQLFFTILLTPNTRNAENIFLGAIFFFFTVAFRVSPLLELFIYLFFELESF